MVRQQHVPAGTGTVAIDAPMAITVIECNVPKADKRTGSGVLQVTLPRR